MLSNYCCAQVSNFKRVSLLGHTLRQGYVVRPAYTFCTCRRLYPDDNYIFKQDSAPSHRWLSNFFKQIPLISSKVMPGHQTLPV